VACCIEVGVVIATQKASQVVFETKFFTQLRDLVRLEQIKGASIGILVNSGAL